MPKDLSVRRKGDINYCISKTGLLALMWKDLNTVTMLSTVYTVTMEADKLLVVKDYNIRMKGVNTGDQMVSYY